MSMYRRFYGWENFSGANSASGFTGVKYDPIDLALNWAFRRDNSNELTVGRVYGEQISSAISSASRTSIVNSSTLLRVDKTVAAQEGFMTFTPTIQEKGITRFGLRMTRSASTSTPTLYVNGEFQIGPVAGAEVYSNYSMAYSTANQVYLEVEIDWAEKILKVFMNDALNATIIFTKISTIYFGSFIRPSYRQIRPTDKSGGNTVSWAYNASNNWQSWGDFYMTYWDGEGEDDGRYGPIHCVKLAPKDLIKGGTLKGHTTDSQFTGMTMQFGQYDNAGILTDSVNAETTLSFDQITGQSVNGELLGYSFTVSATENDNTQPLAIDGNIYHGDKEIPMNPKISISPIQAGLPTSAFPNMTTGFVPAEELQPGEKMTVGAKLIRSK